jgi:hypothetical protein
LISIERVFNRLSKVHPHDSDNLDNPHAFITFLLYGRSMER